MKRKNDNVQTCFVPMQQGRKGEKERKPLFVVGAWWGWCVFSGVALEKV
jgi:hypothetical protein